MASFKLLECLVGQNSETDALDEVLGQSHSKLDKFLDALDDLHLVRVLALAVTLNPQLLRRRVEDETDNSTLPVCHLHLLDWRRKVTVVREWLRAELGRLGPIGLGEAQRFNIGAHTPLDPVDPELGILISGLVLEDALLGEHLDAVREFSSEERCVSDDKAHVLLITRQKELSDVLNVEQLALVNVRERLDGESLAHLIQLEGVLVRRAAEPVHLAKLIQSKRLFGDLAPHIVHLFTQDLDFSEHGFGRLSDVASHFWRSAHGPDERLHLLELVALHLVPRPGHHCLRELKREVIR